MPVFRPTSSSSVLRCLLQWQSVKWVLIAAGVSCAMFRPSASNDLLVACKCLQPSLNEANRGREGVDEVPDALKRVYVAVSAHFKPSRLGYLRANLELIGRWETRVDICVGTDNRQAMQEALQTILASSDIHYNITMCPIRDLTDPMMLNWRTKDVLEDAVMSAVDYTAFIFMEDDMLLTWQGLLGWATDAELLRPLNLTRSFMRYEVTKDGDFMMYDYKFGKSVQAVKVQDKDVPRYFVQAGDSGAYCALFVAERSRMLAFIESPEWKFDPRRHLCCGEGGRELASYGFQHINQPDGWVKTGVVPFHYDEGVIDPIGLLHHTPNNYGGLIGTPLFKLNMQARDAITDLGKH